MAKTTLLNEKVRIEYNGDFQQLKIQILSLISNMQQNQYSVLFKQISYAISPQLSAQQLFKYLYGLNYLIQNLGEDHNNAMDATMTGFNKLFSFQQQCTKYPNTNIYYIAQYLQLVQMFFKHYYQIHQNSKFTQFLIFVIQHNANTQLLDILIQNSTILQLLLNIRSIYTLVKQILLYYEWNQQKANKLIGMLLPNKKEIFEMIESDLNISDSKQMMRIIYSLLTYSQQKHKISIEKAITLIMAQISQYQHDKQLNQLNKEHIFLLNKTIHCIFSQELSFALHKHKVKLLETICNTYGTRIVLVNEYPFNLYDHLQSQSNMKSPRTINDCTQLNLDNLNLSTNDCVFGSDAFFMLRYMLNRWEIHGTKFLNNITNNLYLLNSMQFQQYIKRQEGKNLDQLCFEVVAREFALIEMGAELDTNILIFLNRLNNYYPFNKFNNLIQFINNNVCSNHNNYVINKNIQLLSFQNKQYYLNFYRQNNEVDADVQGEIFNGMQQFGKYIQALEQLRNGTTSENDILSDFTKESQQGITFKSGQTQEFLPNQSDLKQNNEHISKQQLQNQAKNTQNSQIQLVDVPDNMEEGDTFQLVFK